MDTIELKDIKAHIQIEGAQKGVNNTIQFKSLCETIKLVAYNVYGDALALSSSRMPSETEVDYLIGFLPDGTPYIGKDAPIKVRTVYRKSDLVSS
jgi:hypothetical protein